MLFTAPLLFVFEIKLATLLGLQQFAIYAIAMAILYLLTHGFVKIFALRDLVEQPSNAFTSLSFVWGLLLSVVIAGMLIALSQPLANLIFDMPELSVLLLIVATIIPFRVAALLSGRLLQTQSHFRAALFSQGMIFDVGLFCLLPFFIIGAEQNISFIFVVYLFLSFLIYFYIVFHLYRLGVLVSLTSQDWAKSRDVFISWPKTLKALPDCAAFFLILAAFFFPQKMVGLLAISFVIIRLFGFLKWLRPHDFLLYGLALFIMLVIQPNYILEFFMPQPDNLALIYVGIITLFALKIFWRHGKTLSLNDGQKFVAALAAIFVAVMIQFFDLKGGLTSYLTVAVPSLVVYFMLALYQLWWRYFRHLR